VTMLLLCIAIAQSVITEIAVTVADRLMDQTRQRSSAWRHTFL